MHVYTSTACIHQMHDYCVAPVVNRDGSWEIIGPSYSANLGELKRPATCKFCDSQCECECHVDSSGGG